MYKAAIRAARPITFSGVPSRVVSVEYLIALLLLADRLKDRMRVAELLPLADRPLLSRLLRRFNDEKDSLSGRLRSILETGK